MRLKTRTANRDDFAGFYGMAFPAHLNDARLRATVQREWDALLCSETSFGLLVEDLQNPQQPRVLGAGVAVFVHPAFAHQLRYHSTPWLNAHLSAPMSCGDLCGRSPLLSYDELAHANTHGTLSGVLARWHLPVKSLNNGDAMLVRGTLYQGFQSFSRGYQLQELFVEATGSDARDEALAAGFRLLNDYHEQFSGAPAHTRPCLLGVTRQEAVEVRASLISHAFVYQPPRLGFTRAERELLQLALDGSTDAELMDFFGLTRDAIKSRWRKIFQRVADIDAQLLPDSGGGTRGRGEEKRGPLLEYLLTHLEELRPHVKPRQRNT